MLMCKLSGEPSGGVQKLVPKTRYEAQDVEGPALITYADFNSYTPAFRLPLSQPPPRLPLISLAARFPDAAPPTEARQRLVFLPLLYLLSHMYVAGHDPRRRLGSAGRREPRWSPAQASSPNSGDGAPPPLPPPSPPGSDGGGAGGFDKAPPPPPPGAGGGGGGGTRATFTLA
ncbi:hypothetical protein JCM10295v2_007013 [Rhodotorula toruloides]